MTQKIQHNRRYFLSCDWGTSTFRLRLVNGEDLTILSEIKTDYGIAVAFENWKQAGARETGRAGFYKEYLFRQVKEITTSAEQAGDDLTIVLSGMVSSSIGMLELPYKQVPFRCDGSDLVINSIPQDDNSTYKMIIISGVSSGVDVIRGEETMLAGCDIQVNDKEQLLIFPGTHSKHIQVKNGWVNNFATYMTGELFDLLSNKSILAASVKKPVSDPVDNNPSFVKGVKDGNVSNLSNIIFHVRTNQLFKKMTPEENYAYLSGLLLGHELKDVLESRAASITLVCGEGIKQVYLQAFEVLGLSDQLYYKNADEALIAGQWKLCNHFN